MKNIDLPAYVLPVVLCITAAATSLILTPGMGPITRILAVISLIVAFSGLRTNWSRPGTGGAQVLTMLVIVTDLVIFFGSF